MNKLAKAWEEGYRANKDSKNPYLLSETDEAKAKELRPQRQESFDVLEGREIYKKAFQAGRLDGSKDTLLAVYIAMGSQAKASMNGGSDWRTLETQEKRNMVAESIAAWPCGEKS
jgi:hypothetical protein